MHQKTSLDPTELIVLIIFAGAILSALTDKILLRLGNINPYNIFINTTIILIGAGIILITIVALYKEIIKLKIASLSLLLGIGILSTTFLKTNYSKIEFNKIQDILLQNWTPILIGIIILTLTIFIITKIRNHLQKTKYLKQQINELTEEQTENTQQTEELQQELQKLKNQTKDKQNLTRIKNKLQNLEQTKQQLTLEEDQNQPYNYQEEKPEIQENILELTENAYEQNQLTEQEINYLLNHKYIKKDFVPIGHTKQKTYLVKNNPPESTEHTLLVHNIIKEIKKYTNNYQVYTTVKPDIIFIAKDQKYALEIEMGYNLKKNRKRLEDKKKANDQAYNQNWYIVPYHSRDAIRYSKYAKTIRRTQIQKFLREIFK